MQKSFFLSSLSSAVTKSPSTIVPKRVVSSRYTRKPTNPNSIATSFQFSGTNPPEFNPLPYQKPTTPTTVPQEVPELPIDPPEPTELPEPSLPPEIGPDLPDMPIPPRPGPSPDIPMPPPGRNPPPEVVPPAPPEILPPDIFPPSPWPTPPEIIPPRGPFVM